MINVIKQKITDLYILNLQSRALNDLVVKLFLVRELHYKSHSKEQDLFCREFERTRANYWGQTYFSKLFPALGMAKISRARHHTMTHLNKKCDWFEIAAYNIRNNYSRFTEANKSKEQQLYYKLVDEILLNVKDGVMTTPDIISTTKKRLLLIEKLSRLDMSCLKTVEDVILADSARVLIINLITSTFKNRNKL